MTSQPLGFATNSPTLNITAGTATDSLVLTLTNQTGAPLTLTGGTPVAEGSITPASPSTFYFSFGSALPGAVVQALQVTAAGWNAAYFSGLFPNWGVCPAAALTLQNNQSVQVTIANIVVAGPPRPAQLNIDYDNFGAVPDGTAQIKLQIQNAPIGPTDLTLDVAFLTGNTVYTTTDPTTPIDNSLYFTISNPSPSSAIVPDGVAWEKSSPIFNISFVYGTPPGIGALTSSSLGATMSVDLVNAGGNWSRTAYTQGDSPYWTIQPDPDNNHEVLGTGAQASVELAITALESDLPVGAAPDVTLMYVQYANIPNYNDGFVTIPITKVGGPAILTYYADPASVPVGGSAPITLHWTTENTASVSFDAPQIGAGYFTPNGQGPLAQPVTLDAGQAITMTAYLTTPGGDQTPRTAGRADVTAAPMAPSITVQRTLNILTLTTAAIKVGLSQLNLMAIAQGKAYQGQTWGGNGYLAVHQFAQVTLATSAVSLYDFNTAIDPSEGPNNGLQSLCASPDGSTLYAVLATNVNIGSDPPPEYDLVMVTVETATNVMKQVWREANTQAVVNVVPTADGRYLYLCTFNVMAQSIEDAGGVAVLDTSTFAVVKSYPWSKTFSVPWGMLWAISPDGTKGYMVGLLNFGVIDFTTSTVISTLVPSPPLPNGYWLAGGGPCLLSDGSRFFVGAAMPPNGTGPCLLVVDIDPVTYAMQVAQVIDISPGIGAMTLTPDERTLFVFTSATSLVMLDTQTLQVQNLSCALPAMPVVAVAGEEAGMIYTSAGSDFTTITIEGLGAHPAAAAAVSTTATPARSVAPTRWSNGSALQEMAARRVAAQAKARAE